MLKQGGVPIHEEGLPQLIERNVRTGRLHFTTDVARAVHHGDLIFIAAGGYESPEYWSAAGWR